jgi:transcriptional regulator with XRE-family HTH domain
MKVVTPLQRHVELGSRIRTIRVKKGIRQVDLAANAGISWRHLIRIERGEGGQPKPETLDGIASALGVERKELTGDDDEEAHPVTLAEALRFEVRRIIREEATA